ncbi:serine/threonine protein kinase [Spiromyces aspiralis]|uniref:Serine/threonine protein kinase n=1 Tax=Spiromyces aspiralis TaxID=68401 RepID=A0ACC1HSA2_9FUNG|nr:serine/threonine protein kinase [Spiromyces aspiralis]
MRQRKPNSNKPRHDSFSFVEWESLFDDPECQLVENAPDDVWGVLLSLSPDDYPTVRLSNPQSHSAKTLSPRPAMGTATATTVTIRQSFGYCIGRHRKCDIRICNPHVSNRHCIIYHVSTPQHEIAYLEDISTNGTFVNSKRIPKNTPFRLTDGDIIQLAKYSPRGGVKPFNDNFFMFQDLSVHRRRVNGNNAGRFEQNYLLTEQLGKGAFAVVKKCINRLTGQRYAVKIISRARVMASKHGSTNFEAEISILTRVRHIYGVYRDDDNFYLVLDLAKDGELFDEIIKRKSFSEDESRIILLQLLLAIRYLNKRDIVHRDIKPENILLSNKDKLRVKLADFGLAKIVSESVFMKTICGTPMYVAPEVLKARVLGKYDKQVDIWSLGVVFYICLCGFPPFSEEVAPPPLKQQIMGAIYQFHSPYWDDISSEAKDLVRRMLVVNPRERITVDEALAHPWLRASSSGGTWRIDGIEDFEAQDPEYTSADSQTQTASVGSPPTVAPNSASKGPASTMPSPWGTSPLRQQYDAGLQGPPTVRTDAAEVGMMWPHVAKRRRVGAAEEYRLPEPIPVVSPYSRYRGNNNNNHDGPAWEAPNDQFDACNNENVSPGYCASNDSSQQQPKQGEARSQVPNPKRNLPSEELIFDMSMSTDSPPKLIVRKMPVAEGGTDYPTVNKRKVVPSSSN